MEIGMGAELAIQASNQSTFSLHHFADTVMVKMELTRGGKWVMMGRATMWNFDGDVQGATAKIIHDTNVVIDQVQMWLAGGGRTCIYLQSCFVAKEREVIALECNTYKGEASFGSLIAFRVDDIQFQ